MDDEKNPYQSPTLDPDAEMRRIRRRRKLTNFVLTVGVAVVLFVAYWGARILLWALNKWLFGH